MIEIDRIESILSACRFWRSFYFYLGTYLVDSWQSQTCRETESVYVSTYSQRIIGLYSFGAKSPDNETVECAELAAP